MWVCEKGDEGKGWGRRFLNKPMGNLPGHILLCWPGSGAPFVCFGWAPIVSPAGTCGKTGGVMALVYAMLCRLLASGTFLCMVYV